MNIDQYLFCGDSFHQMVDFLETGDPVAAKAMRLLQKDLSLIGRLSTRVVSYVVINRQKDVPPPTFMDDGVFLIEQSGQSTFQINSNIELYADDLASIYAVTDKDARSEMTAAGFTSMTSHFFVKIYSRWAFLQS